MTPVIFTRNESGLARPGYRLSNGITVKPDLFGAMGRIDFLTFHHSAGAEAHSQAQARAQFRLIQIEHAAKEWGDIAYHLGMDSLGNIYHLRPLDCKGAHTSQHNSGNAGFVLLGNYSLKPLREAQLDSLRYLFRGGIHHLLGRPERAVTVKTHSDWPGPLNQTECPGDHLKRHIHYLVEHEKSGK